MKKLTVIALSLLAAGAALADGGSSADTGREAVIAARSAVKVAAPQTSRAVVVAELLRARQAGELQDLDREGYEPQRASGFTRSRAEVVAELARARSTGALDLVDGERSDYAQLASVKRESTTLVAGQANSAQ
jgi:hypothetical protein